MNLDYLSYEEVFELVRSGQLSYDEYEDWLQSLLADRYSDGYSDGWDTGCEASYNQE